MKPTSFADVMEILIATRDQARRKPDDAATRFLSHCMSNAMRSRSQFLQDLWVIYELGPVQGGYFVEFGAADGVHASNSLLFETRFGWNGILAEPARGWQPALKRNRKCHIDTRCVFSRSGETVTFNEPRMALHSTIEAYADRDELADTRADGVRYAVETVSLNDLLETWKAPERIEYLSLDTEGSELDILQAFDFDRWDVRCITVEHNHTDQRQALHAFLTGKGYVRRFSALSNVDDWYLKPKGA